MVRQILLCSAAYPLLITFVVVATADHFPVDALLGGLVAGASASAVAPLGEAHPAVWAFPRAGTEAAA